MFGNQFEQQFLFQLSDGADTSRGGNRLDVVPLEWIPRVIAREFRRGGEGISPFQRSVPRAGADAAGAVGFVAQRRGVSMLDGFPVIGDRPEMDEAAGRIAKQRLFLGILNVGFWVVVSVAGLWLFTRATAPSIGLTELCFAMVCLLGVQSLFDWAGGTLLMPASALGSGGFLSRWGRAVAVHTGLLVAVGTLLYWSHRWFGSFCPGVIFGSFGLMWARLPVLQLLAGVRVRASSTGGSFCLSADASDPAFTGGISGMGRSAVILWPAAWEKAFAGTRLEVVRRKRLWEMRSGLPARAFLAATAWNIAGCWTGAWLLELPARVAGHALLLHGFWMTVWGFVGLLLLPSASRSSVYASDHAVAAEGLDVADWIQTYPEITGEDGSPKLLVQRVFYPIPSAGERLRWLKTFPVLPVLGNVARTNLYLSLATLTLLGRCVHCNVGRPELWVFAPTD